MATATNIALSGNEELAYAIGPLRLDTAAKVSQILNENHKKWDIYVNDMGHHVGVTFPLTMAADLFHRIMLFTISCPCTPWVHRPMRYKRDTMNTFLRCAPHFLHTTQ